MGEWRGNEPVFPAKKCLATYRWLSFRYRVGITVLDQMLNYVRWSGKCTAANGAIVWRHCVLVRGIGTRMMRSDVLAQHNALVERSRAHWARVRLFTFSDDAKLIINSIDLKI